MNTIYLKYAVEVEKAGSITQAANNLFISQPNLSKAIHELEDLLGIAVFKRTSKGIVPTPKGSLFLKKARNILAQIENLEAFCKEGNAENGPFSAAIPHESYIARAAVEFVASVFLKRHGELRVMEADSLKIIGDVADGAVNLGILCYQKEYEKYFLDMCGRRGLRVEPIWEYTPLLLLNSCHPLAGREKIEAEDLAPFCEIRFGDAEIPYIGEEKNRPVSGNPTVDLGDRYSLFQILSQSPETYMFSSPLPEDDLQRFRLVQRVCGNTGRRYRNVMICPIDYTFGEEDRLFINILSRLKNQIALKTYD